MIKWVPFTIFIFVIAICSDRLSASHRSFGQRLTIWTAAVYFSAVSWLTMTPTSLSIPTASKHFFYFHQVAFNVIPFQAVSWEFFLNIVMTIPAGVYLYLASDRHRTVPRVFVAGLCLGLFIESSQFIFDLLFDLQRTADIDDVITNAVGVYIGFSATTILAMTPLKGLLNKLTVFQHH